MITFAFGITHWLTMREAVKIAAGDPNTKIVGVGCMYVLSILADLILGLTWLYLPNFGSCG
jgi:hypothetical protein